MFTIDSDLAGSDPERSRWEGAAVVVFDIPADRIEETVAILASRGYDAIPYYSAARWDVSPGGAGTGQRRMKVEAERQTPGADELARLDRQLEAALANIPAVEIVGHENWEAWD